MSTLTFEPLKGQRGRTQSTCDACQPKTERAPLRIARWKATILGHPLGLYCNICKQDATETWKHALVVLEEVEEPSDDALELVA